MPPIKIQRTQNGNGAPSADVTPEEAAAIRASVAGKEQTPSSRVQSLFDNWREVANVLGDPFEVNRIPISKLDVMRRDPMLAFGLSFTKTPHVRASWYINARDKNGPNAQVAAHLDHDLRRVYASFTLQALNMLDYGFQATGKRFEFRTPAGTFIEVDDSGTQTEKPIWSEGGIQPIAWKPFVPLKPDQVNPIWDNGTGEFAGIEYAPVSGNSPGGIGASASGGGAGGNNSEKTYKIDLYHSLWITNAREENWGSVFGYPRLGYAYRYWWSYWFRWAIADRAFERKADPSVVIYHPEGEFIDPDTGSQMSYAEYALLMGERMRSGGVIALPSETYEDQNGRGTIRQWEIDFTKDSVNFDPFDKSFEYLDVQKLRSLFIPEQAFLEGKGGTSSRNVAAEMGQSFVENQAVLSSQLVDHINRFVIPQWVAVNYPEFLANGGVAEIVVQGFADSDTDFMNQVVTLIGQQQSGMEEILKLVDLKRMLEERGTPIVSFAEQQRREQELAAQAQAATIPGAPGVATVPNAAAVPAGGTAPVPSATGFSYIGNPAETIYLSETGTSFIENLPSSPHYEDTAVKGFARQLWTVYRDLYRDEYESAIAAIEDGSDDVQAADVELADFRTRAARLIEKWKGSSKWEFALSRSLQILGSVAKRASKLELKRSNLQSRVDDKDLEEWVRAHLAESAAKIAETTRTEVRDFIARKLEAGVTDQKELAKLAREHFDEFPQWKADRVARTEVRDVYNGATLLAAQAADRDVQAIDAQISPEETDSECMVRDGKIFKVKDAFKEDEHPNGTLAWRILPVNLSVRYEELEGGLSADFDESTYTVTLTEGLSPEVEGRILKSVVDVL